MFRFAAPAALCAVLFLPSRATALDRPLVPADGVRDPVFAVLLGFVLDDHEGDLDSTEVRTEVEKIGRKPKLPYRWIEVVTRSPEPDDPPQPAGGTAPGEAASGGPPGRPGPPDILPRVEMNGHAALPDSLPRAEMESHAALPDSDVAGGVTRHLVTSRFDRSIDLPVPYQILSYHPGSFQGTAELRFQEFALHVQHVAYFVMEDGNVVPRPFVIEDVRLYVLERGLLQIDIDGWLDRLAGGKLDDTRVAGLVVFRKNGQLFGMALGYNRKGEARSGTIAFAEDKILYPNPPELKAVARQMRRTMESFVPGIPAAYAHW